MFGLIPKEEKFFQMFQEMGGIIVEGAKELKKMLDNYSDPATSQKAIKDIEHRGDVQTHEIIKKLNKSFITPFDREDIYSLASALDDILDLIDGCAQRLVMYNVENTTPEAKELAFLILKGAEAINKALFIIGGKHEPIAEYCV
ncbi:MAG TPA: DUF47 family protein, partial [Geobacteraceae bacterium]|nr:DUF47 family protein [Geobacteraceae bacterium]